MGVFFPTGSGYYGSPYIPGAYEGAPNGGLYNPFVAAGALASDIYGAVSGQPSTPSYVGVQAGVSPAYPNAYPTYVGGASLYNNLATGGMSSALLVLVLGVIAYLAFVK